MKRLKLFMLVDNIMIHFCNVKSIFNLLNYFSALVEKTIPNDLLNPQNYDKFCEFRRLNNLYGFSKTSLLNQICIKFDF